MPSAGADFPVAILAGGLATRLRPITEKIPKLLVEVAGEPFFSHQLRLLRSARLVRVRRAGRLAYYSLDDHHVLGLLRDTRKHVEEAS